MKLVTLLCVLALAGSAHAEPAHTAVSLQLVTLASPGVSLQVERDLGVRNLSLAGAIGVRAAGRGEYDSLTAGVGVELRRWFRQPMRGWYAGLTTNAARTSVDDVVEMRTIGSLWTWSTGVTLGRRWVIRDRIEITPSLGAVVVVERGLAGRSPTTARGAGTFGLTAGWTF